MDPTSSTKKFGQGGAGDATTAPNDGLAQLMGSAASIAQGTTKGFAFARDWIRDYALEKYPLTSLGMAFGLGVFAGWLVKRR